MTKTRQFIAATAIVSAMAITIADAQVEKPGVNPTPGFNNRHSRQDLTPDKVETRIGTLKFVDGVPTAETTQKVYDNLDFMRGVEVFLNFIPAASIEAAPAGPRRIGVEKSNQAVIFDQLMRLQSAAA